MLIDDVMMLLRRLYGIKKPINRSEAVVIARQYYTKRRWSWAEPIDISQNIRTFRVQTDILRRGAPLYVLISARDGSIVGTHEDKKPRA